MAKATTLSVPKSFAEKLREEYGGSNDLERLKKWAEEYDSDTVMTEEEVREICKDVIESYRRGP